MAMVGRKFSEFGRRVHGLERVHDDGDEKWKDSAEFRLDSIFPKMVRCPWIPTDVNSIRDWWIEGGSDISAPQLCIASPQILQKVGYRNPDKFSKI